MSGNKVFLNNHPRYHRIDYKYQRTIELLALFPYILAFVLLDPSSSNYLKKVKRNYNLTCNKNQSELKLFLTTCKSANQPKYNEIVDGLIAYKNNKSELSKKKWRKNI